MKRECYNISISYIEKSVDGRPSIVFIDKIDGIMVALKPSLGLYDKPLFVPCSQVFEHDDALFEKLRKAYECREERSLERLWRSAKSLRSAA